VKQIKDLKERDNKLEQILHALSLNEHVPEILHGLRNGHTYESIVDFLGQSSIDGVDGSDGVDGDGIDGHSHSPQFSQSSDRGLPSSKASSFQWTPIIADTAILEHLFQLYFAWIHPVHTLFSEAHFTDCYRNRTLEFCSTALVNAICALACHLHTQDESDEMDFEQLESDLSEAVRSTIDPDNRDLCTTQAFAVLFLLECARGQCLRASPYLNIASSNLSEVVIQNIPGFLLVVHSTTQGIRCFFSEWAQLTFQVPNLFPVPTEGTSEQMQQSDDTPWFFYRYVTDQGPSWPALLGTTNKEKDKLIAINKDVTSMLYGPPGYEITANAILHQYHRYLNWRERLPSSIGSFDGQHDQPLPHVLSLLILYSTSVILLLGPLLSLPGFPSAMIEQIVWTNAQEGLFLLDKHYRGRYSCRYQGVLQMFEIIQLCDTIFRYFPIKVDTTAMDGRDAVMFGMEALSDSRAGFPISGPLQAMLRRSALKTVGRHLGRLDDVLPVQSGLEYSMDDFIDTYTRPTYQQPVADIRHKYEVAFIENWKSQAPALSYRPSGAEVRWHRFARSEEERGAQYLMQIRNLLNDG